jgi:hypothetical protein
MALGALSSAARALPTGDIEYRYYCPRSNTTYVGTHDGVELVSGPYLPFARTQSAVAIREEPARRSADTKNCSTREFLCLRIEPGSGLAAQYLFLPRVIEPGHTYHFDGMDAIAYSTTAEKPPSTQVQVILWQRIDGRETPITLTVEQGRGVIYVDGLEIWNSPALWPPRAELCVLDSEHGVLKNVRVAKPAKQPEPRPD